MTGWQKDKKWSDGLLPNVKQVLGLYLIGEASQEDDQTKGTDLIVLKMEAVRIACRIRRYNYYLNSEWRRQFTLRANRPSGTKTELAKIIEGWGDYFLYGFAQEDNLSLAGWVLADLKPFRLWYMRYLAGHEGLCPGINKCNADGSAGFVVLNWADMPGEMIIAQNLIKASVPTENVSN